MDLFIRAQPYPSMCGRPTVTEINPSASALKGINVYTNCMALVAHGRMLITDNRLMPLQLFLRWHGPLYDPSKTWADLPTHHARLNDFIDAVEMDPILLQKMKTSENYANLLVVMFRDEVWWPSVRNRLNCGFEHQNQVQITSVYTHLLSMPLTFPLFLTVIQTPICEHQ